MKFHGFILHSVTAVSEEVLSSFLVWHWKAVGAVICKSILMILQANLSKGDSVSLNSDISCNLEKSNLIPMLEGGKKMNQWLNIACRSPFRCLVAAPFGSHDSYSLSQYHQNKGLRLPHVEKTLNLC